MEAILLMYKFMESFKQLNLLQNKKQKMFVKHLCPFLENIRKENE